jgi:hypothetical protein
MFSRAQVHYASSVACHHGWAFGTGRAERPDVVEI